MEGAGGLWRQNRVLILKPARTLLPSPSGSIYPAQPELEPTYELKSMQANHPLRSLFAGPLIAAVVTAGGLHSASGGLSIRSPQRRAAGVLSFRRRHQLVTHQQEQWQLGSGGKCH